MKKGGQSLQKKQFKRMISKLRFDDEHTKKNIVIVKIISQIAQSLALPKVTESIHKVIKEHGFEDFHQKMIEKDSKYSKIKEDGDES